MTASEEDINFAIEYYTKKFNVDLDCEMPFANFSLNDYIQFYGQLLNMFQLPQKLKKGELISSYGAEFYITFNDDDNTILASDFDHYYNLRENIQKYLKQIKKEENLEVEM